jgi:peptide deformylase
MILEITTFDHPALRTRGTPIPKIDESIKQLATDMIDTMRQAEGLGLAAQQVGMPLQMFVLDVPQIKKRPSAMRIAGKRPTLNRSCRWCSSTPRWRLSEDAIPRAKGA